MQRVCSLRRNWRRLQQVIATNPDARCSNAAGSVLAPTTTAKKHLRRPIHAHAPARVRDWCGQARLVSRHRDRGHQRFLSMASRRQLSLYVPDPIATAVESVRRLLDPLQSRLIPAHVTLCREDELAARGEEALMAALDGICMQPLMLRFGAPVRFSGHGILLPCVFGEEPFAALRQRILGARSIRRQPPHITLAHPRNPRSSGNTLDFDGNLPDEIAVTFTDIRLIEQEDERPWHTLGTYQIAPRASARAAD
jgi:2'-5' RNA ligase